MKIISETQKQINDLTINMIPFGEAFYFKDAESDPNRAYFMRVMARGFLLNSNVISESLARNKSLIVNIQTGSLMITLNHLCVVRAKAQLFVSHG